MYVGTCKLIYLIIKQKNKKVMKKVFVAIATSLVLTGVYSFVPTNNNGETVTLSVDGKSKVDFVGSKKGDFHPGTFAVKSGSVTIHDGKLAGGKFVIDVANVRVTDGAGVKLEGHLKSPDFFDAAKYPEATFEITGVSYLSTNTAEVAGTFNFKGNNIPLKFPVYIRTADANGIFAQAFFAVDKNLLGITYGKGNLSDDIQISIHLYAKK